MKKFIEIIKKLYTKNKVVFLISSFVVLVALGLLVWYFILNPMLTNNDRNDKAKLESELAIINKESQMLVDANGYKKFADKIDQIIKNRNLNKETLIYLYTSKAVSASNSDNFEDCYQAGLKIESLSSRSDIAELIGNCLLSLGKKDEAILYYQKAISRITGDSTLENSSKYYIQSKIDQINQPMTNEEI